MCVRLYWERKPCQWGEEELVWAFGGLIFPAGDFLVWVYGITMICPLQYEGACQENVKGLLSEILQKQCFVLWWYRGFYRKVQRDKGRKHFGFLQGVFKAGQNNLNTTGWQELRTCKKGFLQLWTTHVSAEVQKNGRAPFYALPGSI